MFLPLGVWLGVEGALVGIFVIFLFFVGQLAEWL